ncbi:glycosyltransferase family 4 protein [Pontibacter anaerobius]|uniref:Glycosyltransferase family 4 protein n=1 Tax=Pontibacter anaerobius TaxID=2993940 RepID=A0ABT3RH87_9BACT|nr:glycosyltransferase family 4 protein [Pontibacter anaerobius]MCX2741164.1 glycosyltransferase family 4 protein [Pontibacter anaerobius]
MVIGVSGPVDIELLESDFGNTPIPKTNTFPLTSHFVNALTKRGYRVIVYTNSGEISTPTVLHSDQVTVCIGCTKPQPGRRIFKYERDQLQSLMQEYPADIIYAFWTYEYAWAALDSGIPTVVSVHDIARKILVNQPDMFRLVRFFMNAIVMWKSKWLVANSSYTYAQLSARNKKKATVINNFYTPHLDDLPVGTAKENYIVSVVMGFTKRKGVPKALHAFARLRKKFPTLEYKLIGADMEPGGDAQKYAQQHNIEEGVRFLGPLSHPELMQHVAGAKALLHPSVEESFGMAVLESMIVGTPVVGGRKSGFIPHLLNHGGAGVLCDINSDEEMSAGVARLLSDTLFAGQVASNAYAFARANFSEDVVVAQHLQLYSEILNTGNSYSPIAVTQKENSPLLNNQL